MKNQISIKTEQEETDELLPAVSDPVRVVETVDGLSSNIEAEKIGNEEKRFYVLRDKSKHRN